MNRAERRRQNKKAETALPRPRTPKPAISDVLFTTGVGLYRSGHLQQAEAVFRRILATNPAHADALHLLGLIARQSGDSGRAIELMTRAIEACPGCADIHNNLGLALHDLGRWQDAADSCRRALRIRPGFPEAHCNLGNALLEGGRPSEAAHCYRQAIAIRPDFAGAWFNLGNALRAMNERNCSMEAFRRAIALKPDYAKAHCNLADQLKEDGRLGEAFTHFRRAREIEPNSAAFHTNVIFLQDFDEEADLIAQQRERTAWNEAFARPLTPTPASHSNDRNPERRLRIGYVSGDFRSHSACQGFAPLILEHDPARFEVFCYAENAVEDATTARLQNAATGWRRTRTLSDDSLARLIHDDGIDILVDLSGHTEGNRLLAFARRPAPVQMTGIGHLAPGLSAIDYRLTTSIFTAPEEAAHFPESPIYLDTFFGFLPPADAPEVVPTCGPKDSRVVFAVMNRLYKISDRALRLWARILQEIPAAHLLIKYRGLDDAETSARVHQSFADFGVTQDQLTLIGGTGQREHLDAYNRVDIALDPFPQGGGISTLESLWMGVPVIGLYDHRKIVHRSIRTVCAPLGLDDWIAESEDDYLRIAVRWATQRDELAVLKAGLRDRVRQVYSRFPAEVERAYRIAWRRWCQGLPPEPIHPSQIAVSPATPELSIG